MGKTLAEQKIETTNIQAYANNLKDELVALGYPHGDARASRLEESYKVTLMHLGAIQERNKILDQLAAATPKETP